MSAAGEPHGLTPLGLSALDMLRIESGLIFANYEFDDQVDPFEAGIGFAVVLDGDDDFVGKEALIERSEHPQRKLVGLELEGQETAGHGDCVHVAPNVFILEGDVAEQVAPGTDEALRKAARACPASAIILIDAETNTEVDP